MVKNFVLIKNNSRVNKFYETSFGVSNDIKKNGAEIRVHVQLKRHDKLT